MRNKLFLLVLLSLFNPVFAAPTITINPGIFDIEMYGGESIQKNLTITATGFETAIIVDLYTSIKSTEPDLDGFNINFSETQFTLNNNQPKNITMNISTVPNIKPDSFKITIKANTQIQKQIVYRGGGGSTKIIHLKNKTNQTIYDNQTIFVPYYINQTKEFPKDVVHIVNQTVFVENTTKINELKQSIKDQHNFILFILEFLAAIFTLIIIITIVILIKNLK